MPTRSSTDVALVRRLLAGQFPHWADLTITRVASYGTDHDIYRLGEHFAARLPRIGWATEAGGQGGGLAAETRAALAAGDSRAVGHGAPG